MYVYMTPLPPHIHFSLRNVWFYISNLRTEKEKKRHKVFHGHTAHGTYAELDFLRV